MALLAFVEVALRILVAHGFEPARDDVELGIAEALAQPRVELARSVDRFLALREPRLGQRDEPRAAVCRVRDALDQACALRRQREEQACTRSALALDVTRDRGVDSALGDVQEVDEAMLHA